MTLFLFAAAVFTAMISGVIGMGGGVALLAIMSIVMPLQMVIPIHGVLQLNSNVMRSVLLHNYIQKKVVFAFMLGTPVGAFGAYFFVQSFFSEAFVLSLIVLFIVYSVFKPKEFPSLMLNQWQFTILAVFSGFMGILIGATGPLLAPFFLRDDYTKEQLVATKACSQIIIHLTKLPVFLALGFDYLAHLDLFLLMILGIVLGTAFGVRILKGTSDRYFMIIYKVVLCVVAIRLIAKVIPDVV
ncbi:MAG: sulfite exporter TauE/SafE family protein [Pseudomonadota bacterium]